MGAGAAQVKPRERHPIIAIAQNGARRKELPEAELSMKDIAIDEAEAEYRQAVLAEASQWEDDEDD